METSTSGLATLAQGVSPSFDGSHQLCSSGEAPQSGHGLSSLQYTMLSDHPVHIKGSRNDETCSKLCSVISQWYDCR